MDFKQIRHRGKETRNLEDPSVEIIKKATQESNRQKNKKEMLRDMETRKRNNDICWTETSRKR